MIRIVVGSILLCLLCLSSVTMAQQQPKVIVIPLDADVAELPATVTLTSGSGEWSFAGLTLPPMILKDLIFYVNSDTSPPCEFSMNYVIDQFSSRTIRRFSLSTGESTSVSFESGIDTANLRFGTIGGGTCVRHWTALGYELPSP